MKCIATVSPIAIFCLSVSFAATISPTQAQETTDTPTGSTIEQISDNTDDSEIVNNLVNEAVREMILLETAPIHLLTEDTNILNLLADQINQEMDGPAASLLPEGMVIRGSNSSLQLGSEF
ncbi:MAG: hypothetical protein AB4042_02740 [Leptolyngbyaceae cyanobacterium]